MGLSTVMQTALSGMNAASISIEVAANNLANLQTRGFKASNVQLATLASQAGAGGGSGAIQIGQGVYVAAIGSDFSQGTIVTDDQPALLALDGKGFFILEGPDRQRRYTRDGQFGLNADGELVTKNGERVLGFGVDAEGNIDESRLAPLSIRLGSSVAGANGTAATLRSYSVSKSGRIIGHYSDGRSRTLGQLRLARFANPSGLVQGAGNTFEATPASGLPNESDPGSGGAAEVIAGASELSNVDLGRQLIELTLAGNLFRANALVFHTADTLLGEMFFPWRR
jgi:flagellar hook protein FlgE